MEWKVENAFIKDEGTLKNIGVINTHLELDQNKVVQLAEIGEYLALNGITKLTAGEGMWLSHKQLDREKEEAVKGFITRGLDTNEQE